MRSAGDESIADAILTRARETGSRLALRTSFGSWTGTELVDATIRTAQILRHRYAGIGSPVLILMDGDPYCVAAFLAVDLVGRTAVLLHPSSTGEEMRSAAASTCAQLLLQSKHAPVCRNILGEQIEEIEGLIWTSLSPDEAGLPEAAERQRPPGFLCQQTSGTMGRSKLALRTRSAVRIEMDVLQRSLLLTAGDGVLCSSAVSHSYGCIGGLLTPLLAGAAVILARTPEETRAVLLETEPSIVYGLGPTYVGVINGPENLDEHLKKVRFAFSAGAPLLAGLFQQFKERFAVPIRQNYGTSESGTISLDLSPMPQPPGVGHPLQHMETRLRPPADIPLEPGEAGEILVRSRALARGYLVGGRVTPCTDDWGWYATQDAGSWVDDSLCIMRRLRPLPFINGEPVNLEHVERVIRAMPGVVEVVVWPGTDEGRSVLVAGVATHVRTAEEVQTWTRQRLPHSWVPDRVTVFERLPRSPAGKILNQYLWGS